MQSAETQGYNETLVQRDVRDLARIASLDALPRLLTLAASQTGRLINISDLASPFQLSRPTIRNYVTLLERVFVLEEPPPWHSNRLSRLIKTPKLHVGDTGLDLCFVESQRRCAHAGPKHAGPVVGDIKGAAIVPKSYPPEFRRKVLDLIALTD